jgi:hypothetical protein
LTKPITPPTEEMTAYYPFVRKKLKKRWREEKRAIFGMSKPW